MSRLRPLANQFLRFGLVGAAGLVVDVGLFNLLRATVLDPEVRPGGVMLAKVVSTLVAIGVNWAGNRYWTFSAARRSNPARQGAEFFLVSLLGMGVPLACLWVSHYVLGFTSVLADNLASNGAGLVLGAMLRFALYRSWVFSTARASLATTPERRARESVG